MALTIKKGLVEKLRFIIYIYKNNGKDNATDIYTDDRNRVFYDKPHSRQPAQQ